jgi:hypothetical protein
MSVLLKYSLPNYVAQFPSNRNIRMYLLIVLTKVKGDGRAKDPKIKCLNYGVNDLNGPIL